MWAGNPPTLHQDNLPFVGGAFPKGAASLSRLLGATHAPPLSAWLHPLSRRETRRWCWRSLPFNIMEINLQAPVIAYHQIIINASIETIWQILTDIDRWNIWNSNISESRIEAPLNSV
ncbi:hypothetical protein [Chamaesiphon minutus]|uniref:Polyketide cyclase / dehydrase and lipid transport n=1 Tax=Chamaesiphon minutus (strain ATCC 27169 / PCC 6605) TaxID=1173020 RepID=K9UIW4_CHAP6|nr:hypothetical protein [Chamaesiphon minutus]AFY94144.1 hypothetical protein Cha6605_3124 [Chamaesiphon minutus PCC 6605]